jgi:hypothetical protein
VSSGAIFRRVRSGNVTGEAMTPSAVRRIVKARALLAGLGDEFSAHSLRSGFVTEAARQQVPIGETMAMTGHTSVAMVMGDVRASSSLQIKGAELLKGCEVRLRRTRCGIERLLPCERQASARKFAHRRSGSTVVALHRIGVAVTHDSSSMFVLHGRVGCSTPDHSQSRRPFDPWLCDAPNGQRLDACRHFDTSQGRRQPSPEQPCPQKPQAPTPNSMCSH